MPKARRGSSSTPTSCWLELANASVSTRINSYPLPIVSERAMYWGWELPGGWLEAHNSFGMTATANRWGLAEGRAGGSRNYRTYVLVLNNSPFIAQLRVTFIREDGVRVERLREVGEGQRLTIDTSVIPELANSNFSTIVESTNNKSIAVESSIYWDPAAFSWMAAATRSRRACGDVCEMTASQDVRREQPPSAK